MNSSSDTAHFRIIGAGLAGSEAALTLAAHGFRVEIFEQKPKTFSAAHRLPGAAELVCSNSFKSIELGAAHGLLKAELSLLGSPLLAIAWQCRVPGGKALSIDREKFSATVTSHLKEHPLIDFKTECVSELRADDTPTLLATGPLTGEALMKDLQKILQEEGLYFYDATAPVVTLESLDLDRFFWGSRRDDAGDDYLNLPLNKEEYHSFRNDLLQAEKMEAHLPEEKLQFFEGCLPIEVLAERGEKTLAFSCMKPIGLSSEKFPRPYAVIQFRREKAAGELLSMVGFQTRMKWGEQTRVFQKLPGMSKAEFVRLGAMHRNSFINAPKHLTENLELKARPLMFMAGQITGSEGYTEALATGHYAALSMMGIEAWPETSAIRSLVRYLIHSDEKHFQPMNFNFGLLPRPQPQENRKRGKTAKIDKRQRAEQALQDLWRWKEKNSRLSLKTSCEELLSTVNFLPTATEPAKAISNA